MSMAGTFNSRKPDGWHPDDHKKYIGHLDSFHEHSAHAEEWRLAHDRLHPVHEAKAREYAAKREQYHKSQSSQHASKAAALETQHVLAGRGEHPVKWYTMNSRVNHGNANKKMWEAKNATKD